MPKIAITCGDPSGVGPEIVSSWLKHQSVLPADDVVLIGYDHWIRQNRPSSRAEVIPVGDPDFVPRPGDPTPEGAGIAAQALEAAAQAAESGQVDAVVTCPVSKKWMQEAGFYYPGQTEFFAERWAGEPTMAFAGDRMRVALVTWHIPFREVPQYINLPELERTIRHTATFLGKLGLRQPRIGVCGLNPHAGEEGILGSEEYDVINPALNSLRPEFPGLSTCQPADTVFFRHLNGEFDVVVALYHDQGLGPLKTVDFETAVNLTLGLRHVRTSPDHGTAFDLAGKGKAQTTSFARAVDYAVLLAE